MRFREAMGSPLESLLANVFMSHVEKLLFNSELKQKVNFWVRYVDDIFVIFAKVNPNINSILAFLNNIHRNIKFTVEHETNHCLHFLDIDIKFNNGVFTTSTYNKPTSTDLYTMWNSFCPLSYRLSTIRSLFNRSIKLCSDSSVLLKEKLKLINNFHVNLDYPLRVLYDMYNVCVAHLTDKLIFYSPHKPTIYVFFPFIGQLSCNKVKRLKRNIVFKNKCMFDLKFVFVNNFTIGSLFKFKDCLSLDMKSHVVYRLDCVNCSAGYIGVTTRLLPARV